MGTQRPVACASEHYQEYHISCWARMSFLWSISMNFDILKDSMTSPGLEISHSNSMAFQVFPWPHEPCLTISLSQIEVLQTWCVSYWYFTHWPVIGWKKSSLTTASDAEWFVCANLVWLTKPTRQIWPTTGERNDSAIHYSRTFRKSIKTTIK